MLPTQRAIGLTQLLRKSTSSPSPKGLLVTQAVTWVRRGEDGDQSRAQIKSSEG